MISRSPRFLKGRFLILVLLVVFTIAIPTVSAVSVSGAKYMDSIKPGTTATHTMVVSLGSGDSAADIQVDVLGFGQGSDMGYSPLKAADDVSPYSARSLITIDNSAFHLEPGTSKTVTAKISISDNAGAGGRYAIIYIHALPGKDGMFTTAINVPVLITISGTTPTEAGNITNLSVSDIIQGQPISVMTTLKNSGNYHYYYSRNSVKVVDAKGNTVGNFTSEPSIFAVIPGNTVLYKAKPPLENLPVGIYTVDSQILLENGKVLDEKTTTFSVKTNYIPPITESNITLTPASSGILTSPDGRFSVSFPQGAVLGDAVVTLKPYAKSGLSNAPSGSTFGATSFEITGLTGLLSKDATVRVTYSADDLAAAGGDTSKLKLSYYDAAQHVWIILPTQVDTQAMTLTATTNHLSVWAVMVSSTTSGSTPITAAAAATATPLPPTIIFASLIIAVIAVGTRIGKRK